MRSGAEDLTTRARIRDAAVLLFGRDGFESSSVRDVARVAGVSAGSVIHHFGSEEGLRRACDQFVVGELLGRKDDSAGGDTSAAISGWMQDTDTSRPMIDYTSRMLTADTSGADELFDALLESTRTMLDEQIAAGIIREPLDRDVIAVYVTLYGLIPLVMQRQLGRALGVTWLDGSAMRRSTLPVLDLYTNGLYADDRFLVAAREALARTNGPRSDKGENDPNQDPDPPHGAGS